MEFTVNYLPNLIVSFFQQCCDAWLTPVMQILCKMDACRHECIILISSYNTLLL